MSPASLPAERPPRAVVLGCSGESLTAFEQDFFAAADPVGFCLFRRNCSSPDQVRDLVRALRDTVGRDDAPVLIDQEGGRVARLRPPHWRLYPSAARIAVPAGPAAEHAAGLVGRLIADDLATAGHHRKLQPGARPPRSQAPIRSSATGLMEASRAGSPGLRARCAAGCSIGAVLPVLKHIPGHGRARVDSHLACPRVETGRDELSRTDFLPFRELAHMPWAMTAHIVYTSDRRRSPGDLVASDH